MKGLGSDGTHYGASFFSGSPQTTDRILYLVEQWAIGYTDHINPSSGAKVKIAIGTSNEYIDSWTLGERQGHARAWANLVNDANAWAAVDFSDWISFSGANDMEPCFSLSDCTGPDHTRQWLSAFIGAGFAWNVFDYGGAGGCGQSHGNNTCNNGWHTDDEAWLQWDSGASNPLPEVYVSAVATEEYYIDYYAVNTVHDQPMNFVGSVSECEPGSCSNELGPNNAWSDLYDAVNPDPGDTHIQWSVVIKFDS